MNAISSPPPHSIFSLGIAGQVLTFHTRARLSFAPPTCRMPLGPSQASPELSRRQGQPPVLTSPKPLSTLHRRFACARLSQSYLSKSCSDFSATLTTMAFDRSSLRWLEINTCYASPFGPALLVTQDPLQTPLLQTCPLRMGAKGPPNANQEQPDAD